MSATRRLPSLVYVRPFADEIVRLFTDTEARRDLYRVLVALGGGFVPGGYLFVMYAERKWEAYRKASKRRHLRLV